VCVSLGDGDAEPEDDAVVDELGDALDEDDAQEDALISGDVVAASEARGPGVRLPRLVAEPPADTDALGLDDADALEEMLADAELLTHALPLCVALDDGHADAAAEADGDGDGLAVAMGASPWDELTLDLPYDAQSTEAGGHGSGAFPHTAVDPGCPTFVLPQYHDYAGMGHRLSNWVMGLVAAISLAGTLLHTPMDYSSKPHYNYTGLDAFLGMGVGEWREDAAMAMYPNLTRVHLPRMDNYASMAKGGMFSPNGRVALWHARRAALTRKCYIM
jgi:hypothetical protein